MEPPPVEPPPVEPPPVEPPAPDPFTAVLDDAGRITFTGLGADGAASISFQFDAARLESLAANRNWNGVVEEALRFDVRAASGGDTRSAATFRVNQVGTGEDRAYRVSFGGQSGSGLELRPLDLTTGGLGLGVDEVADGWSSRNDILRSLAALDRADARLQSSSSTLQSQLTVVQTRQTFNEQFAGMLQTQAQQMLAADSLRDYAQALALSGRQQAALGGMSMMFSSPTSIFDLMGDSGFGSGFGRRGFFT